MIEKERNMACPPSECTPGPLGGGTGITPHAKRVRCPLHGVAMAGHLGRWHFFFGTLWLKYIMPCLRSGRVPSPVGSGACAAPHAGRVRRTQLDVAVAGHFLILLLFETFIVEAYYALPIQWGCAWPSCWQSDTVSKTPHVLIDQHTMPCPCSGGTPGPVGGGTGAAPHAERV
jgi:hypothetical protein